MLILFPAAGVDRSKTGKADDTVPIDGSLVPWLWRFLKVFKSEPSADQLARDDYPLLLLKFKEVSKELGLSVLPSLGRRSGASIDRAKQLRSLTDVQKRSRWKAVASGRRYEKVGRLNDGWETLTPGLQGYFTACEWKLEEALSYGESPEKPSNLKRK